jgi:hypothetical protein
VKRFGKIEGKTWGGREEELKYINGMGRKGRESEKKR